MNSKLILVFLLLAVMTNCVQLKSNEEHESEVEHSEETLNQEENMSHMPAKALILPIMKLGMKMKCKSNADCAKYKLTCHNAIFSRICLPPGNKNPFLHI